MREFILLFSCLFILSTLGVSLLVFTMRNQKRRYLPLSNPLTTQQQKFVRNQLNTLSISQSETVFLGFEQVLDKVEDNNLSPDETKRLTDLLGKQGISVGNLFIIK